MLRKKNNCTIVYSSIANMKNCSKKTAVGGLKTKWQTQKKDGGGDVTGGRRVLKEFCLIWFNQKKVEHTYKLRGMEVEMRN